MIVDTLPCARCTLETPITAMREHPATGLMLCLGCTNNTTPTAGQGATNKITPEALFLSGIALLSDDAKIEWLIRHILEAGSTGVMFGPSGEGKSFVCLDWSLSIATKRLWNGMQTEQGAVLYLAGEGRTGLKRRVKAWHIFNGCPDISAFHMTRCTVPLDAEAVKLVVDAGKQVEKTSGHNVRLIVVDTLARHLTGDENSTKEMTAFISFCESIRSQFPVSTLLIVHHTGNSEEAKNRSRGSSALKAAMDFEWRCDKGTLTATKMKDSEEPAPILFKLRPVQIGTDDETGEPVTSCVVEYGERSQKQRQAELTPTEKELLKIITDNPDELIGDIRRLFHDHRLKIDPDEKRDTTKKAFSRAWEGILSKGFATLDDNTVMAGHGTNGGHLGDTSHEGGKGTKGHTYIYTCPAVPPPCPPLPPDHDDLIPDFDLEGF